MLSVSASWVGLVAFQWSLVDAFTPFFLFYAERALRWALLVALLSALSAAARYREFGRPALLPAGVLSSAALLVWFTPLTDLWLLAEYRLRKAGRVEVLDRIGSGRLRPNVGYNPSLIALGPEQPLVSRGGNEVVVEEHDGKRYVLFYTFRGILDNYSGFLHVPPGGDPARFSDLNETASTQIVAWEDGWYFVSHR